MYVQSAGWPVIGHSQWSGGAYQCSALLHVLEPDLLQPVHALEAFRLPCVCVCVLLAVLSSTAGLAMSNQCICVCTQACLYVLPTIIKTERNQCMCVYACSCRLSRTVRVHNMSIHCATYRRNWYIHVGYELVGRQFAHIHAYSVHSTAHALSTLIHVLVHTSLPP